MNTEVGDNGKFPVRGHALVFRLYEPVSQGVDDSAESIVTIIQHDGCSVSYCHLSKVMVKKGKEVKAGETVAISGNSGRSTGPHLHVTYRVDGNTEKPAYLIDGIISRKERLLEKIRTVGK